MSHPFEVGKTYRNRAGEYVVQAIEGERMRIRYDDGRTLVTSVQVQARIWENIQFEKQMARTEERRRQAQEARREARQRTARARRVRAKPSFDGLEESDFEEKKRGIAWSSRKELGRVLAYELTQRTGGSFAHWIVPRQSKIDIGLKEHYDKESSETNAAFSVTVDEEGVLYGFRVGRPSGKARADWPWSRLVASLADAEPVRKALHAALDKQGLNLDVYAMEVSYGPVGRITAEDDGFLWQHEDAGQEVTRHMSGEEVAEYLQSVAPSRRCDLYVGKRLSPQMALQAGAIIATVVTSVFESLMPLYEASVGS
jgi:hypothetical protein